MKVILTKIAKATINILLSFISVVISLLLSYWIAERYFFDKLFYQKSIQHGYWIPIEGYKERVADLLELESRLKDDRGLQLHDKQPSNKFTIAVIGDSYVWGQGVRFSQTATQGLEKKLNKYRNTEVLSFAYSGDNILDYAHRYHQIMQSFDVDLYIFALVINDILLATGGERFRDGDFGNIVKICSSKFPESKLIYEYNLSNLYEESAKNSGENPIVLSWKNESNLCVLNQSLSILPHDKNKSIYFITTDYTGSDPNWEKYKPYLHNYDLNIISSENGKSMLKYSKYWGENIFKYMHVSEIDTHPSKLAHEMYADILYEEIINNSQYGFLE